MRDSLYGTLLAHASPEFRARVVRGLSLVTNGIILLICGTVFAAIVGYAIDYSSGELARWAAIPATAIVLWGYWMFTHADPGFRGDDDPRKSRRTIRVLIVFLAIVQVFGLAVRPAQRQFQQIAGDLAALGVILGFFNLAAWLVVVVFSLTYARWIALRTPSNKWATRARTYRWLIPLLVGLPILFTFVVGLVFVLGRSSPTAGAAFGVAMVSMMFAPCWLFITGLVCLVLYWNLLHYVRKGVLNLDRRVQPPNPGQTGARGNVLV